MLISGLKLFKALISKNSDAWSSERTTFYASPLAMDLNGHMNNASYLNYANRARLIFLAKKGFVFPLFQYGVRPVIGENSIEYKQSIKLARRFTIETRFQQVSAKSLVIEQVFRGARNCIFARLSSRVYLLGQDERTKKELLKKYLNFKDIDC